MSHDIAQALQDSLRADIVLVRRLDGDEMRLVASAGEVSEDLRDYQVTVDRVLMRGPVDSRLPWVSSNVEPTDRESLGPIADVAASMIYAPLFSGDDIHGTLVVACHEPRVFGDDEVAFVAIVGTLLAGAFATSKRVRDLEDQQRRNRSLIDVIYAASSARSLTDTLREICALVADSSAGERCSILLYKEEEEKLVPVMSQGHVVDPELYKRFRAAPTEGMRESVWREAILARKPLIFPRAIDLAPDDPMWRAWVENFSIKSIANFPLYAGNRFLGLIAIDAFHEEVNFAEDEIEFLTGVANQIGVLIYKAQLEEMLREQASTDPLTRLYNRRFIEERLNAEISRTRRSKEPLSLLLLDVDDLKQVNDKHGHLVGDALLRNVGKALKSACRVSDVVARFAGDEFLAILPATGKAEATKVVERVLALLKTDPVDAGEEKLPLQVSMGVAEFPTDGEDADSLFATADADLYRQKPVKSFLP